jgi:photosystem II stability/assembly factor-like uncharacterized protein
MNASRPRATDRLSRSGVRRQRETLLITTRALISAISILLLLSARPPGAHGQFWEPTAGPTGPSVESLSRDPSGTIIAATVSSTYRSTNSGRSWQQSGPGGLTSAAGSAGVFLVGSNGQWVYRSTDDGLTWNQHTGLSRYVRQLVASPGGLALAGTAVNELGVTNKGAFYYSPNGGAGWNLVWPRGGATMSEAVQCVALDSSGHFLFSSERGTIHHTADTGKTIAYGTGGEATTALLVAPGGTVYSSSRFGVWRSTSHGLSWSSIKGGLPDTVVTALVIRGGNELVAGTPSGLFRYVESGSTWSLVSPAVTSPLDLLAISAQELLAGTSLGVMRSSDGGLSWSNANLGMGKDYVTGLAIDPRGRIYAGTTVGSYRTSDRGESWSACLSGLAAKRTVSFWFKDSLMGFAACSDSGVCRTTDGGASWSEANNGLPKKTTAAVGSAPGGAVVVGTWYGGIYRSTNNGTGWSHVDTGKDTTVTAFALTPAGDMLMGTVGAVLRSTNGGLSWSRLGTGLPGSPVRALAVASPGRLLAGLDAAGVHRSTDGGLTWSACNSGLPTAGAYVRSLALNRAGDIFVGAVEGCYRSTNGGDSWEPVSAGVPVVITPAVLVDPAGFAYAGTGGAGVWRSITTTGVAVSEERFQLITVHLEPNYPNPFNSSTRLVFTLGGSASREVRLSVYDLLGREVAVPVNDRLGPGTHSVPFDARHLSSGAYILRLQTGTAVLSRAIHLVK